VATELGALRVPESARRQLTASETRILAVIRDLYGDTNDEDSVFFSPEQDAVIFIHDQAGVSQFITNLSLLARMHDEGTTLEEIREQWLEPNW
jgi:hypothetical protein